MSCSVFSVPGCCGLGRHPRQTDSLECPPRLSDSPAPNSASLVPTKPSRRATRQAPHMAHLQTKHPSAWPLEVIKLPAVWPQGQPRSVMVVMWRHWQTICWVYRRDRKPRNSSEARLWNDSCTVVKLCYVQNRLEMYISVYVYILHYGFVFTNSQVLQLSIVMGYPEWSQTRGGHY